MEFDYPKKVRFKCTRCALCCGDTKNRVRTILLLKIEASCISRKTSKSLYDFAEKVDGFEPYGHRMRKTGDGKCVFLRDNLCFIYEIRPLICRFYPFEFKNVRSTDRYVFECTTECPGIGKGPQIKKEVFEKLFKTLIELVTKSSSIT